jgi:hypothetical protein
MNPFALAAGGQQPVRHAHEGFHWQGALPLANYLLTGLPLLRFFTFAGLVLLALAVIAWPFSRIVAFGLAMWGGMFLVGFPYLGAATQLRVLVANRRLGLLPGFAFTCTLLLLAWTTLLAVLFPLIILLCGIQLETELVALRIFIIATLFSIFSCALLRSRRLPMVTSTLPLAGLGALYWLNRIAPGWWFNPQVALALFSLCVTAWAVMLFAVRGRQHFARVRPVPVFAAGFIPAGVGQDNQEQYDWQPWLFPQRSLPPAATLLLGHAGDWRGRCQHLGVILLLSPAFCATLLWFVFRTGTVRSIWLDIFLFLHLCIAGILPLIWGELAARTRWLWLRHGTQRDNLWQALERELWRNLLLLAMSTTVAGLQLWLVDMAGWARTAGLFLVLPLGGGLHNAYFSIMVRTRLWAGWLQVVGMLAVVSTLAVLAFVMRGSPPGTWVLAATTILLTLAAIYRSLARGSFAQVDWLRLKPLAVSRNTAAG